MHLCIHVPDDKLKLPLVPPQFFGHLLRHISGRIEQCCCCYWRKQHMMRTLEIAEIRNVEWTKNLPSIFKSWPSPRWSTREHLWKDKWWRIPKTDL